MPTHLPTNPVSAWLANPKQEEVPTELADLLSKLEQAKKRFEATKTEADLLAAAASFEAVFDLLLRKHRESSIVERCYVHWALAIYVQQGMQSNMGRQLAWGELAWLQDAGCVATQHQNLVEAISEGGAGGSSAWCSGLLSAPSKSKPSSSRTPGSTSGEYGRSHAMQAQHEDAQCPDCARWKDKEYLATNGICRMCNINDEDQRLAVSAASKRKHLDHHQASGEASFCKLIPSDENEYKNSKKRIRSEALMKGTALARVQEIIEKFSPRIMLVEPGCPIKKLPFVNREQVLYDGAKALLENYFDDRTGDSRRYKLVFCAQLFGIGKTSYAARMVHIFKSLFGDDRVGSHAFENVIEGQATMAHSVARMLWIAACYAKLFPLTAALPDEPDLVIMLVQEQLAKNNVSGSGVSHLFLILDEFDLSVSPYNNNPPAEYTAAQKRMYPYYMVWRQVLGPILRNAPNVHVIVAGRPIELALCGTGMGGPLSSPTDSFHAILGTLTEQHLLQVLEHMSVDTGDQGQVGIMEYLQVDDSVAFIRQLRVLTGGVPRYVCLVLEKMLRDHTSRPDFDTVAEQLYNDIFVTWSVQQVASLLQSDHAGHLQQFLTFAAYVVGEVKYDIGSQDATYLQQLCDQFCGYADRDADGKVSAVMPKLLRQALARTRLRESGIDMKTVLLTAAGSNAGDDYCNRVEIPTHAFVNFGWLVSKRSGKWSPAMQAVLEGSGFLSAGVVPNFTVPMETISLGKIMKNRAQGTQQSVRTIVEQKMSVLQMRDRNIQLSVSAQSHSADWLYSLCLQDGHCLLLGFACKSSESAVTPVAKVHEDIGKFGAMVAAFSPEQLALYSHRVLVLISRPSGVHEQWCGATPHRIMWTVGTDDSKCGALEPLPIQSSVDASVVPVFEIINVSPKDFSKVLEIPTPQSVLSLLFEQ